MNMSTTNDYEDQNSPQQRFHESLDP